MQVQVIDKNYIIIENIDLIDGLPADTVTYVDTSLHQGPGSPRAAT